jgi:signal transduction histidine kinase
MRSLRLRLVLGAALWVSLALAVGGAGLRQIFADHVAGEFDRRMEADLDQLAAALEVTPDGRVLLVRPLSNALFYRPLSGLYWQVSRLDGSPILRSRSTWDGALQLPPTAPEEGAHRLSVVPGPEGAPARVLEWTVLYPDFDRPLRLAVGHRAAVLDRLIDAFTRVLVLSLAILALGVVAAAWAQVAFGLQPLSRLRAALAGIRSGRAEHLSGDWPSEVTPLVDDLNELLDHNARMVTAARESAGNLAHALKTPLAVLGNEAADLAARGQTETAALLGQQVEGMRRHVEHHLARARAQVAGEARGLKTPVGPSLDRMARVMRRLHDKVVEVREAGAPDFRGDQQTLEEILGTLTENACQWAASSVRLSARGEGGRLLLAIEDDGPGIPAERLEEVLRRGRRLDERRPGSGLGLSIADDLARAAHGELILDRSPEMGGLRCRVFLPGAA